MPPRKRAAAAAAATSAVTPDEGVATENVVRDPDEVPEPAAVDVAPPLPVENVVIDDPAAEPGDDSDQADSDGQDTP